MASLYFCVTADDINLEGYSSPEHLKNLVDFWDGQGLKGTLFVVPRSNNKELGQIKEYVEVLKYAVKNGHEVAQHGLDHTRCQTGIPPKMVLDLPHEGPAREYLAKNRSAIEASLSIENIRKDLALGKRILESALGEVVHGFRAPCLSTCPNLFKAISDEGYVYDSSHVFQEAAWELINNPGKKVKPLAITRDRFNKFQISGNTRTLPISAEYTWYLKKKDYDTFLDLAKHDLDGCLAAEIPFVPVCHVSPVQEGDADLGFELYRKLVAHAKSQASRQGLSFVAKTLFETCHEVSNLF
jgi:peptidoglycan/xylan/chitin deacetylase (PgdA/CDA1 family)